MSVDAGAALLASLQSVVNFCWLNMKQIKHYCDMNEWFQMGIQAVSTKTGPVLIFGEPGLGLLLYHHPSNLDHVKNNSDVLVFSDFLKYACLFPQFFASWECPGRIHYFYKTWQKLLPLSQCQIFFPHLTEALTERVYLRKSASSICIDWVCSQITLCFIL